MENISMNLNLFGSLSRTGYGIATLNIAKALYALGVDITITPIGGIYINNEEEHNFVQRSIKAAKFLNNTSPCLKIWHQFDLSARIGKGIYFAMPIFELDKFTNIAKHHLTFPDQLLVNSSWASSIIENEINRKSHVIPLGIDNSIFCSVEPNDDKPYQFLNIGKWEKRKHDILSLVFNKAFSKKDDVYLNLVPHNPFLSVEETNYWIKSFKDTPLGDKIFIFNEVKTHQDIANLIKSCDCGIYPSHSEGWNLELLETIACNKPVISVFYSGHTEYCTNDNSYLVYPTELEPAIDNKWFHGEGNWARLDNKIDDLVDHMRYCYKNNIRTNPNGVFTGQKFTWENSAKQLIGILNASH
jgi:glycosyltransferase involved in cell wall biosynthesis